jgi:hypothetical protein
MPFKIIKKLSINILISYILNSNPEEAKNLLTLILAARAVKKLPNV